MKKSNTTKMTVERILGYLQAVYAAINHKRVPFRATNFRKSYGISPHVNSAMLANGVIYQDTDESGTKFWIWLADEPSMILASQIFAGYKARIKRYGKNAALTRAEDEARRKAMERLQLIKQGEGNKGRMQDVFNKAKAASNEIKLGARSPVAEPIDAEDRLPGEGEEDPEEKKALDEATFVREERKAVEEMDYAALEERICALIASGQENYNTLNTKVDLLLAKINRLLKLHGADGVE